MHPLWAALKLVIHASSAIIEIASWLQFQLQYACMALTILSSPCPKLDSRNMDHTNWGSSQLQNTPPPKQAYKSRLRILTIIGQCVQSLANVLLWLSDVDLLIILWHSRFQWNGVIKTYILARPSIFPPLPIVMYRIPQGSDALFPDYTETWKHFNFRKNNHSINLQINNEPKKETWLPCIWAAYRMLISMDMTSKHDIDVGIVMRKLHGCHHCISITLVGRVAVVPGCMKDCD